ncbi:uncharacterized protein [Montipora foliosa]|uniref:uncharacterized protein n=1 Tax=Montipora foliosa TaxID=591990 RepID=UPI0035F112AA
MMVPDARRFWHYQVDGGWAWVVCFASFFNHSVIFGTIQSFGTLFISLLSEFNAGESATAWVGSLGYGFLFVIGPVTTVLCEHFGCRVMACTGSVLTFLSLLLTSFATSIPRMYFTFGVLWGTGGSFLFFSGLLVLRFYFSRNHSFANGITMTGAGFGTLVFNIILQELDSTYGWRGGMRTISVFAALTFLGGCAYIPPPVDYLPFERPSLRYRLKRLIDPRPWRDKAFPMWVLSLSFILFAYFFPYTYLVKMALTLDIPVSQGALLLGYFSISAIFGKLTSGRLADLPQVRRLYICVTSAIILSLSSMCVTAAKSYHGLLAYTIVAGFFDGCFVVTVPLITQDIVGKELMAKALGNLYGVVAFPLTLGPPVLGELYKSTGSFTVTFFVSASVVLLGVSLIYVVQRLRPDLVQKPPSIREEIIPSPSIHSASVVDTLSGLCVTEPTLSASHLDPMEVGSYQRFDTVHRDDLRANFIENLQGRLATQTEVETVYKQAVDKMVNEGKTHSRNNSNDSSITRSTVPVQSTIDSARGSVMSAADITSDITSPINLGEKYDLPSSNEPIDDSLKLHDDEEAKLPDDNQQERNQELLKTLINRDGSSTVPEVHPITTSAIISLKIAQVENNNTDQHDFVLVTQQEVGFSTQSLRERNNGEQVFTMPSNVQKTTLERESEEIIVPQNVLSALDEEDINSDTKPLLNPLDPSEEEHTGEETQDANEILELVRIPPPPSIPRTGQLVALGTEETVDQERADPDGLLVSKASLSEIAFDGYENDPYDRETAGQYLSSGGVSPPPRRERLHLAVFDQLNLLSERLEAVAARQVQEEELDDGIAQDQRPVFSPAMQSLHLTPLYSANQSVPLTPARARSSFVNTPAPTPRMTQPSAVHTSTAPTPIPTPQTLSHCVSGVFNVAVDVQTSNMIQAQNSNNIFDVQCSPTPSQASAGGRRSGSSSLSDVGHEMMLNNFSLFDSKDTEGSTDALPSKDSSFNGSSIANDSRSLGDLNSVSEPIDVVGTVKSGSHGGHLNSPVTSIPNLQVKSPLTGCAQHPYVQSEDGRNSCHKTYLVTHQTEQQTCDVKTWTNEENVHQGWQVHGANDSHFHNERTTWLPQETTYQSTGIENYSLKEKFYQKLVEPKPYENADESENAQQPFHQEHFQVTDSGDTAAPKLEQNVFPEGTSDTIVHSVFQASLDSSSMETNLHGLLSDSEQHESTDVPQEMPFQRNEVCITIAESNESINRITSDPIVVPCTPQEKAHTEVNPFVDTENAARSLQKSFPESALSLTIYNPNEPDFTAISTQGNQMHFNSKESNVQLHVDLGQTNSTKVTHHILSQGNELCQTGGVHHDCQNCMSSDVLDLPLLNPFWGPRERKSQNTDGETPQLPNVCSLDDGRDDVNKNIQVTDAPTDPVPIKDTQHTQLDSMLPTDEPLLDRSSLSPQGASLDLDQPDIIVLVGKEMRQQNYLQEKSGSMHPEASQTDITAVGSIQAGYIKESDHSVDSKSNWTMFPRSEEVLIFEMDTDSDLTDSVNSSSDSTNDKQDHGFAVDQPGLFPPLQIFSDNVIQYDGAKIPQKLPPPPRQVQRKRIDMPICTKEKCMSGGNTKVKPKGIFQKKIIKENEEKLSANEPLNNESEPCSVPIDADLSAAENTLSEIDSDLLSDSKLEKVNNPCTTRLSDNSISEIACDDFEADDIGAEELDNSNLDGALSKSLIHEDIAPLLMQSEKSIQYLNLRDLPGDSGVLQRRPSTTSSADDSSVSSTSTDSSLSENEMPYSKLHECSSDSSEHV